MTREFSSAACAVLLCDVRHACPPEQGAELAQILIDACVEALDLRSDLLVEFTQHSGDELYRPGARMGRRLDVRRGAAAGQKSGVSSIADAAA